MKRLLTLALLLPALTGLAQTTLTNDGATLTVEPGATLFVAGAVVNSAAGTLANAGTVALTGDLTNTGTLASAGLLRFAGAANQVFRPGAATVANLTLDNAGAAGQRTLSIPTDLTISGQLVLLNGLLRTAPPGAGTPLATLILPNGATLTGEAPGRYVQGNLRVERTAVSGSAPVDFGNGSRSPVRHRVPTFAAMNRTRLALIEDDPEVRELLHEYLGRQPEFECVLVAGSVEAFLAELSDVRQPPQVLLLDVQLPGLSGIEALPLLRQRLPEADVLMHTVFDDTDRIYQALCQGATGYVLKNTPLADIKAAILEVTRGGAPMSRAVARKVLAHFKPTPSVRPDLLTAREREVVQGLVDGLGDKQVAARLGLSSETVRTYVKRIYKKLHVGSRSELLSRAARGEL